MKVYTIGHSTRSLEELLELLKKFGIKRVIDVRRFPSSKHFPWFNKEFLAQKLAEENIDYIHLEKLGGYRKEGYKNFTKTEEFEEGIGELKELIKEKISVIMCSEFKWWKCHRRYIAQRLVQDGIKVVHILTERRIQEHKLKDPEIEKKMKSKIKCDRFFEKP